MKLLSYSIGEWRAGLDEGTTIHDAVTGEAVASCSSTGLDFAGMLRYGREVGGVSLRALTFHERAAMLKRLANYLTDRKSELYDASVPTGATKQDTWIDIDGGIGTLYTLASKGRREAPDLPYYIDGSIERLSKGHTFAGQHICVPLEGVAVHINAFNFPCWGMLEKIAPTLLAGVPTIVKPATASAYVTQAVVKLIVESGILPRGALQLICGSIGDLLNHLTCQDVVTLTGSKNTGTLLKQHPKIIEHSVRFNLEADSLNCSILAPDAAPGTEEFELFVKELVREMTVKAGQKCTVIRRAIVPALFEDAVIAAVQSRLAKIVIGDPREETVKMGPLISRAHAADVRNQLALLQAEAEIVAGDVKVDPFGSRCTAAGFMGPVLLRSRNASNAKAVHSIEAFGPVSTLLGYHSIEEAITLARLGEGSLVGSLFTADDNTARQVSLGLAPYHGRLLLMNAACAKESTGHGSPMPQLVHGGPGRAGGGEELGGMRSVFHYMQRTALQGSPQRLTAICQTWLPGAATRSDGVHPFRKHFEELQIGDALLTATRTITEADIEAFAKLSGDHFYAHMDDALAQGSVFERRVAHGYFLISAAAGLFVDPAPGPVLANYGMENLRFVAPAYIGDTMQVRIACKQKTRRFGEDRGIVSWDVEIINQRAETLATYVILTLVKALGGEFVPGLPTTLLTSRKQ